MLGKGMSFKNSAIVLVLFVLLGSFFFSSLSFGDGDKLKDRVRLLILAKHWKPNADQWKALGASGDQAVLDVFEEFKEIPAFQARLIHGLSYINTPKASDFLSKIASSSNRSVLRRASISSLVRMHGEKELPRLKAFLRDKDWKVRARVVDELFKMDTKESKEIARAHLKAEKNPVLKGKFQKKMISRPIKKR
jgi:hypothetical protein